MTPATLAVVADDLTGAADAGVGFHRAGLETTVVWWNEATPFGVGVSGVLAVDTDTRAGTASRAVEVSTSVVRAARAAAIPGLFRKVDSTLRGHIGDEVSATLRAWDPWALALVAPAFPEQRRTTRDGEQRLDGAPVPGPSIMRHLERAGLRAGHAHLSEVRSGGLDLALVAAATRGVQAVVCDAETPADLDAISAAGLVLGRRTVWVGSAGLARALAPHLAGPTTRGARPSTPATAPMTSATRPGPLLIVVGSRSSAARAQIAELSSPDVLLVSIDGHTITAAGPSAPPVVRTVLDALEAGRDVAVSITGGDASGGEDASLPELLGTWLRPAASLVAGVVLTGGDTARGVLRAWGVTGLRLCGEVEPGVPVATSLGAVTLSVVTKAGGFGGPEVLASARRHLKRDVGHS